MLLTRDAAGVGQQGSDHVLTATVDDTMPAAAVLVRPDGYVAWATDENPPPAPADVMREVASSWARTASAT